ncbi:3-isopropylmalate dehydratase small subunit [Dictyobacter sp. S3.2.2.5]|uniref:3-isopropylmalate dehydratase small subunit n=1 Tax=Dictyobacter halimunensis TaxID=3026934 RepID=A0ABQ6FKX7_9CHLR|nr:3-isopropylmalate dehydratase small subunit [Dictyobacter sp. S3.2.2.5]GLV54881.1 3-isopropylmalate dehydratase small subunit [Dictyobacter sp. S3.2.2.5]
MQPFTTHSGLVLPLNRVNVNTDEILPARFLKTVKRTGLGEALFANWRYLDEQQTPNPEFVLNEPRYQGASILVAGDNFGCGSSREHAPWALAEYGFRAIIAPSFADIFYNNCFSNSILPIAVPEAVVNALMTEVEANPGYSLDIDLAAQTVTRPNGEVIRFEIDAFRKERLLKGLDMVGWTLQMKDDIASYEQRRRQEAPWLFSDSLIAR